MTEFRLTVDGLKELTEKLDSAPKAISEAKRQLFEDAAPLMKRAVDTAVGGVGKVQSWQQARVGSKGGYAAVSPKAKTFTEINGKGKRYAVGYVTNSIDSGHKFPPPSGKAGYRPRIRSCRMRVEGRHFYRRARQELPQIAEQAAKRLTDALREHFR